MSDPGGGLPRWIMRGDPAIRQVAALPYRVEDDGSVRVLLITTRETRRWVIPKGNPIRGLAAYEAAAQEAFEEAGLSGLPARLPIGYYTYWKRRRSGAVRQATVAVFPLAVTGQADHWPEQHQRRSQWFALADAAAQVGDRELAPLIAGFALPPPQVALARGWTRAVGPIGRWVRARLRG